MASPIGLVNGSREHRYFTPTDLLDRVDATFGAGSWGDPCSDPLSPAWERARWRFDIRAGECGLTLPWPSGPVFENMPFDNCPSWLEKGARHAAAGGQVLALCPAQTGSAYWRRIVWRWCSAVAFVGRPHFGKPDGTTSEHPLDCAIVAFGVEVETMMRVWSPIGTVVAPVRMDLSAKT